MFDFYKAYRVMIHDRDGSQLLGIAVGIRPFTKPYPPPWEKHGTGSGFEWIPNSPIWPVRRAFLDVTFQSPDRVVATEKFGEFAGNDVTYIFEPLTVERLAEVKDDILGYSKITSDLAADEDLQEYYVQTWLRPEWKPRGLEAIIQTTESLDEAGAPVGTKHDRKDGWTWQKQANKSWVRVYRTHGVSPGQEGPQPEEPPEEEADIEFGKWPDVEVPAGGTWKEEAEHFEHLERDPYGSPSTMHTFYEQTVPGDDNTIAPKPEYEERFEEIWDEIHRRSGFTSRKTTPREGRRPVAVLTMGVPASGKSNAVQNVVADKEGFVHIDPDAIKSVLPEFHEAVSQRAKNAASLVHWESAMLAERLRNHARDQGKNFIFDGVGRDPVYYGEMIDDLKAHGYEVQIVMTHVEDADKAVERSDVRGEKSGRWVKDERIRQAVTAVPKSFSQLHRKVDAFSVFDTEEFPPKLAW